MLILVVYVLFVTPFELAFVSKVPPTSGLFVANTIVEACFWGDVLLQFNTGLYSDLQGKWVVDRKSIAAHYMAFWFWLDCVSLLPFEAMVRGKKAENLSILRLARLLRLFKLLRVCKAPRILNHLSFFATMSFKMQARLAARRFLSFGALLASRCGPGLGATRCGPGFGDGRRRSADSKRPGRGVAATRLHAEYLRPRRGDSLRTEHPRPGRGVAATRLDTDHPRPRRGDSSRHGTSGPRRGDSSPQNVPASASQVVFRYVLALTGLLHLQACAIRLAHEFAKNNKENRATNSYLRWRLDDRGTSFRGNAQSYVDSLDWAVQTMLGQSAYARPSRNLLRNPIAIHAVAAAPPQTFNQRKTSTEEHVAGTGRRPRAF